MVGEIAVDRMAVVLNKCDLVSVLAAAPGSWQLTATYALYCVGHQLSPEHEPKHRRSLPVSPDAILTHSACLCRCRRSRGNAGYRPLARLCAGPWLPRASLAALSSLRLHAQVSKLPKELLACLLVRACATASDNLVPSVAAWLRSAPCAIALHSTRLPSRISQTTSYCRVLPARVGQAACCGKGSGAEHAAQAHTSSGTQVVVMGRSHCRQQQRAWRLSAPRCWAWCQPCSARHEAAERATCCSTGSHQLLHRWWRRVQAAADGSRGPGRCQRRGAGHGAGQAACCGAQLPVCDRPLLPHQGAGYCLHGHRAAGSYFLTRIPQSAA